MRIVTIVDEQSIVLDEFKVSNRDAIKLVDDYNMSWMNDDEFAKYLESGEL